MSVPERVPNEVLVELDRKDRLIDQARKQAEQAVALATPKLMRVLIEALDSDDEQVRLRAADMLLTRVLPKVAAKHASISDEETIDTVDVKALRDSILEEVKKKR